MKWETSEQIDLDLMLVFLTTVLPWVLTGIARLPKDLLIEITPLHEIGVNKIVVNTGKVLNSGLDFELGWRDNIKDFKYIV